MAPAAIALDAARLRALLRALAGGATLEELRAATGRSRPSVYRDMAALRELGVGVEIEGGVYRVRDWGVFDPERVASST